MLQKIKFLPLVSILFLLVLPLALAVTGSKASAQGSYTCYRDVDYKAAGSYQIPGVATGSQECPNSPSYVFGGSSASPTLEYRQTSGSGTSQTISNMTLVDAAADPLVWKGNASYDGHEIRITIPRDGFSSGGSGTNAIRTDYPADGSSPVTSGVRVGVNEVFNDFAEAQGIAIESGSANLDADCKLQDGETLNKNNCGIVGYIVDFTKVLSGLVGIVIVIMIAVGGVQYSSARDDPSAVSAAKTRIQNAILALVFYIFSMAFLNYLIPGGLF